jgi:hypothetical protein
LLVVTWSVYAYRTAMQERQQGWVSSDVGWQWMLGHALVQSELSQSYTVAAGERWLREGYSGQELDTMTFQLFRKGRERLPAKDGIDGPLYPPTAAFFFSIYGVLTPRQAHALGVILGLLYTVLAAFLIQGITRGRLNASLAALVLCFFPHHFAGLLLGQNHALTLLILTLGWWLVGRGKPYLAGLVWGLLIYKPVFLLALLLVPLSLLNWRLFLGMVTSSACLFLATLPFTQGLEPWKRWTVVGQRASTIYELDRRWIWLSRDLAGLPRRAMWNAETLVREWHHWRAGGPPDPDVVRINLEQDKEGRVKSPGIVKYVGWGLPGLVGLLTLILSWRRDEEAVPEGIPAAFLLMGTFFCVFHFMHYDLTIFALPVCLLLAELTRWSWRGRSLILIPLAGLLYCALSFLLTNGNSLLAIPWESFILLGVWVGLGISTMFTIPPNDSTITSKQELP